jgi:hypothetical protein
LDHVGVTVFRRSDDSIAFKGVLEGQLYLVDFDRAELDTCLIAKTNMGWLWHSRTKHIAIRYHFLRDHQQKGDIEISYINIKDQLADIFTKPLDEQSFTKLRHELNILDSRNFFC